ncbi:tripartite motif-containing protein 16-like [Salarias fasciatus]|uniref:tripartite motif-containing protein 16-like n=1 Tax=Salarias fasciatus TaxID=181472 RepID=UPI0011766F73|nr:tripartite motif-containing protein 16-like [Salarias fasciatus]
MAQGVRLPRAKFSCLLCLNLLDDPATIPCGHNYCMKCIAKHLDEGQGTGIYSCPCCKEIFFQRPALVKNSMLAVVVEELQAAEPPADPPQPRYAGPRDLACDVCTGRKLRAVKSCLQCLVSYCQDHLQPHLSVPSLMKHRLVDVFTDLKQSICPRHQEVMKLFCRTDQCCICYLCSKDAHKGHDKVSAAAEQTEKQDELRLTRQQIQQRIRKKQSNMTLLQQEEDSVRRSAENALRNTERTFTKHIRMLHQRLSDMKEKIGSRQQTEVGQFQKIREKLEQEISTLTETDAELDKLSTIEDPTYFLLKYPSLARLPKDPPPITIRRVQYFERLMVSVSDAGEKLEEILGKEYAKMSMTLAKASMPSPNADLETRADFLQYACPIELDPNTANPHLSLSNRNRKVAFLSGEQDYPKHSNRFNYSWQVLSRQSLTGRCYLEVERSSSGVVVAVAYKSMGRAGIFSDCVFGLNDKSWALDCFEFRHNEVKTAITATWTPRVGVFLDHSAGVLCFYGISDTMTLLHRVQTTFTEPLHAGLWLSNGATAELCSLQPDRSNTV